MSSEKSPGRTLRGFRVPLMVLGTLTGLVLMVPAPEPLSMFLPVAGMVLGHVLGGIAYGVNHGDA